MAITASGVSRSWKHKIISKYILKAADYDTTEIF